MVLLDMLFLTGSQRLKNMSTHVYHNLRKLKGHFCSRRPRNSSYNEQILFINLNFYLEVLNY